MSVARSAARNFHQSFSGRDGRGRIDASAVGDGARAAIDRFERTVEREGRVETVDAIVSENPRATEGAREARRVKRRGRGRRGGDVEEGKDVAVDAVEDVVRAPDARGA